MFIGGRLRYSKVVPICAVEADRLSGDIAPVILKRGSIWMWMVKLSALATLQPQKNLWFH
jgi:hypothetical protein